MKTLTNTLILGMLAVYLTACSTVGKTLATTATTVDAAMKSYATFVALGKVSEKDQAKVKVAYQDYQKSFTIALSIYNSSGSGPISFESASRILKTNKAVLLSLISSLTKGKV